MIALKSEMTATAPTAPASDVTTKPGRRKLVATKEIVATATVRSSRRNSASLPPRHSHKRRTCVA
jgi:hypothetical protein